MGPQQPGEAAPLLCRSEINATSMARGLCSRRFLFPTATSAEQINSKKNKTKTKTKKQQQRKSCVFGHTCSALHHQTCLQFALTLRHACREYVPCVYLFLFFFRQRILCSRAIVEDYSPATVLLPCVPPDLIPVFRLSYAAPPPCHVTRHSKGGHTRSFCKFKSINKY